MTERKAVNIVDAADMLGVHPHTVRALVKSGELYAKQVGRRWLIPVDAIDDFLKKPNGQVKEEVWVEEHIVHD